jgi:hypothetical protein
MSTSLWNHLRSESPQEQRSLLPLAEVAHVDERTSADDLKMFEIQRRPNLPVVHVEGLADLISAIRGTQRR